MPVVVQFLAREARRARARRTLCNSLAINPQSRFRDGPCFQYAFAAEKPVARDVARPQISTIFDKIENNLLASIELTERRDQLFNAEGLFTHLTSTGLSSSRLIESKGYDTALRIVRLLQEIL